ncbi:hypothetical protein [Thalassomonas haliotis]|uniref:hypothetical protein n=1 Tax=Thalassomonas haliotis TaxID=485448 RepID=UPI00235E5A88|nr:hypothetical protein [Thalassomonas haliotis]
MKITHPNPLGSNQITKIRYHMKHSKKQSKQVSHDLVFIKNKTKYPVFIGGVIAEKST